MDPQRIKALIEDGLPGANVTVEGNDGTHFQAVIVSDKFIGKTILQQHQLVYKTLGDLIGREIHALSIQTLPPDEWQQKRN